MNKIEQQLNLFYQNIKYDNIIDTYYHHYTGSSIYDGKRMDDILYYSATKIPYTLSNGTLDSLISK